MMHCWRAATVGLALLGGAQGLQVLSPTPANITSNKYGQYFGKQTCGRIEGDAIALVVGDTPCGPPWIGNYSGKVLLLPDLVFPIDSLDLGDGNALEIGTAGCTRESIFRRVVNASAIAAVSSSFELLPSSGEYMHGGEWHDPAIFEAIPLIVAPFQEVASKISPYLQAGITVRLALSCDGENRLKPYLDAISSASLASGIVHALLGLYGLYTAIKQVSPYLFVSFRRKRAERGSSSRNSGNARLVEEGKAGRGKALARRRKTAAKSQAMVLAIVSLTDMLLGVCRIMGLGNTMAHSYTVGDRIASYPAKAMLSSGLAGPRFFSVSVVAIYWLEMTASITELRPIACIFCTRRALIAAAFLLFIPTDLFLVIKPALYEESLGYAGLWIYTILTALVAVLFMHSVAMLLRMLSDHINNTAHQHTAELRDPATEQLERFALHMARWLRVYFLQAFLSVFTLIVLLPTGIIATSPDVVVAFFVLLMIYAVLERVSLIMGLRGPQRSRRSASGEVSDDQLDYAGSDSSAHHKTIVENTQVQSSCMLLDSDMVDSQVHPVTTA